MNADNVFHISKEQSEVDTLTGNVILTQDSLVMFCDRAVVINEIYAYAYDNVVIVHYDTIQIYADSMRYNGITKVAELFGEVILQDGDRRLNTTQLTYNVDDKTAEYTTGGTIIENQDTIVSREGFYYQKEKKVWLKGNVSFVDTSRLLMTDSILYLYDIDQLNMVAPTRMWKDSIEIYCEEGIFQLERDRGILSKNVQVNTQDQFITSGILDIDGENQMYRFLIDPVITNESGRASGDTIIYFQARELVEIRQDAVYESEEDLIVAPILKYFMETELWETEGRSTVSSENNIIEADTITSVDPATTRLSGLVSITDIEDKVRIRADGAIRRDSITKLFASKRQPLLNYQLTADSLMLLADTLISFESNSPEDSIKQDLWAIQKVALKSGNTYGVAQHLRFNQEDSVIILTNQPVLWSDSTQLSGDTIKIYLQNNDVHMISLLGNAFIVSPDTSGMYNQIRGLVINNEIQEQEISRSIVSGNAELFYMVKEGEEYRGINLTKSDGMTFRFEDGQISEIFMKGKPEHIMYEYQPGIDLNAYYLEGFNWRIDERPEAMRFLRLYNYYNK